ncbi:cytochrome B561, N terminal-domain-containing protein [Fimicolochytrium jonesii]|uniref:cytochrome B561, N terminal-domain-containing protein n=1 Tax=Fimicolochytrium jonesii TaxID=1396493 RepID=UPI0022FEB33E|nr:cytochrome B561, N terminal-domain-containing protein [Fimicolochytrium jonesii]KAI8817181.1 cytochrome B561, N terminal-domain-containing protein [Fimicolochytrium jonesii]
MHRLTPRSPGPVGPSPWTPGASRSAEGTPQRSSTSASPGWSSPSIQSRTGAGQSQARYARNSPRGVAMANASPFAAAYRGGVDDDQSFANLPASPQSSGTPRKRPVTHLAAATPVGKGIESRGNSEATPGTPLRWEHPALGEVAQKLSKQGFTDLDRRRLVWNIWTLLGLLFAYVVGWYEALRSAFPSFISPSIPQFAFAGYLFVTVFNVVELLVRFFKPTPSFAEYALTPVQRKLLGLDPSTPAGPESKKFNSVRKPSFESGRTSLSSKKPAATTDNAASSKSASYQTPQRAEPRSFVSSPVSPLAKYMLSSSPAHMHLEKIRDKRALEELLQRAEDPEEHTGDHSHDDSYSRYASPTRSLAGLQSVTPKIPKFQPASKTSTPAKVQERIEDGLVIKEPQKTEEEWRVDNCISEWTENMRAWLALRVIKPLARRITQLDTQFGKEGLGHLACDAATMQAGMMAANVAAMAAITASTTQQAPPAFGGSSGMFGATQSTGGMFGQSTQQSNAVPQTLYELSQKYKTAPLVQERLKLENHLTISDFNCRSYVVARIKTLAQGNNLANFEWNGGSKWEGKRWSHDWLPTDSQLVLHLFCRYLDEKMPGENFATYGNFTFSSKYFIPTGAKPTPGHGIQIRHYTKWPPHYQTVAEGIVYDVYSGRNNVFHNLCLFAFYIKVKAAGYVGNLHVGGKSIELTNSVRGGPVAGGLEEFKKTFLVSNNAVAADSDARVGNTSLFGRLGSSIGLGRSGFGGLDR